MFGKGFEGELLGNEWRKIERRMKAISGDKLTKKNREHIKGERIEGERF